MSTTQLLLEELTPSDCACRPPPIAASLNLICRANAGPRPRMAHSLTRVTLGARASGGTWVANPEDELLVMFGGNTVQTHKFFNDVWIFHVASQSWLELISSERGEELASSNEGPMARSGHVAVAAPPACTTPYPVSNPGARVYIHGGFTLLPSEEPPQTTHTSSQNESNADSKAASAPATESSSFGELWALDIHRTSPKESYPPQYKAKWTKVLEATPELHFAAMIIMSSAEQNIRRNELRNEVLSQLPKGYVPILSHHFGFVTEKPIVVSTQNCRIANVQIESPTLWLLSGSSMSGPSSLVFAIDLKSKLSYVLRIANSHPDELRALVPPAREMPIGVANDDGTAALLMGGSIEQSVKEDMWLFTVPTTVIRSSIGDDASAESKSPEIVPSWGWTFLGLAPERVGGTAVDISTFLKLLSPENEAKQSASTAIKAEVKLPSALVVGGRDASMNVSDVMCICEPPAPLTQWSAAAWRQILYLAGLSSSDDRAKTQYSIGADAPRCALCRGAPGWARVDHPSSYSQSKDPATTASPPEQDVQESAQGPEDKPSLDSAVATSDNDDDDEAPSLEIRATGVAMSPMGVPTCGPDQVIRQKILLFGGINDAGEEQETYVLEVRKRPSATQSQANAQP